MRGKIVNLCFGFLNIFFGALLVLYAIKVPQDKTLLTVQENIVVNYMQTGLHIVIITIAIIDLIQSFEHKNDTTFNVGYTIGIFVLAFLFIKQPFVAIFSILSGLIVFFKSLKENLIEIDSTTAISVSIVLMATTLILGFFALNYSSFGQRIKNRENRGEKKYESDFFRYVTELEIDEPYINVKKDGKFGYINQYGDVVIDYKYDYASPFVKISSYGKTFYVSLVCKEGSTYVMLKNERKVCSYRTESKDDNYDAKIKELEDVYTNTLKQTEPMTFEFEENNVELNSVRAYPYNQEENVIRFDYNSEYDVIVTRSSMGRNDIYELVKKGNENIKIALDTDNLDYDEEYLYLFSNGYIPFYDPSKLSQGWFTDYGIKNEVTGRAQLLDYFADGRIILKNNRDGCIYFTDSIGTRLSEDYYDIYICGNGRYIVKDKDNFFKVIDDEYNQVFEKEYAAINPRFIKYGMYLTLDTTEKIKFNDFGYAKLNWTILNNDGEVIADNIEYIYDLNLKIDNKKNIDEENYLLFVTDLKKLNYTFVGSKFYSNSK